MSERNRKPKEYKIIVQMPVHIKPERVKNLIEGNMKMNSVYSCEVTYIGLSKDSNDYRITAGSPEAFYYIGITAAVIIEKFKQ